MLPIWVFILILSLASLGFVLLGCLLAIFHFKSKVNFNFSDHPGISVLKPLKGLDSGLEENLKSFFHLAYPQFELIFCIAQSDDPAVAVVEELCEKNPRVQARLLIGESLNGQNPKVKNLVKAFDRVQYDHVLISDSNVRVTPDYLHLMLSQLKPGIGMVTSIVKGTGTKTIGGLLEKTFLNTFYARWLLVSAFFNFPCVLGKSMLFKKSEALRFGGIQTLSCYLAEDYMAGKAMQYLGLKIAIAPQPIN